MNDSIPQKSFFSPSVMKNARFWHTAWYSIILLTIIRCKNLFQCLSLKLQFKKFYDEMINTVNIHKEIQLNVLLISVSFFKNLYYLSFFNNMATPFLLYHVSYWLMSLLAHISMHNFEKSLGAIGILLITIYLFTLLTFMYYILNYF